MLVRRRLLRRASRAARARTRRRMRVDRIAGLAEDRHVERAGPAGVDRDPWRGPLKSPFGRSPSIRRETRTGPSGRHAVNPYVSLVRRRALGDLLAGERERRRRHDDRAAKRVSPSAVRSTPSSPSSTAGRDRREREHVAGRMRSTSSIARFQKIVRAVAVQSRSPVTSERARPRVPASSSQAGTPSPIGDAVLVRRGIGDAPAAVVDARRASTPSDAPRPSTPNRRGTATTSAPASDRRRRRARHAPSRPRARRASTSVEVLTRVAGRGDLRERDRAPRRRRAPPRPRAPSTARPRGSARDPRAEPDRERAAAP